MKTMKNNGGFTLIELTIYGFILTGFLVVMTSLFSSTLDAQLTSERSAALSQDSRYIFSRMTYDVSRATDVSAPVQTGTPSGILALTIDGNPVTYSVTGGQLLLADTSGTDSLNSVGTTVSDVSFTRYNNIKGKPNIRIAFTLTSTTVNINGAESRNFQTSVQLR